ncbi:nephrocystin-1-like isoform X1 [Styela clava]
MSLKAKGPLHQLQIEVDQLKKEIDAAEKSIREYIKDASSNVESLNKDYKSCIDMKMRSSALLLRAHDLKKLDEKVQNFDVKKNEEIKRIQQLQARLNTLMDEVESSSSEVEHLRSLRHSQEQPIAQSSHPQNRVTHDEEEVEDGDETEEEDDEEEEYEDDENGDELYEVLNNFKGEQEGDLTIEEGDVVSLVYRQDDGWWKVKDEDGNVGMVPSNFLQEYEDDDDEEEESQLQEDTGEATASQPPTEGESPTRSGKALWKGIKDAVNEPAKTDVTDVLAALGAIPAGFRPSTLGRFVSQDEYTLKNAVLPSFTESNTGLQDLHWDPALNQIRSLPTRVLRSCRLWSCRMIPLAGSGVEILSRHIRLALFNGTNIVSNVHTVRANSSTNSPKLWTFSPRVTGILPSLMDGSCLVRSDITHSNLGILFELGITYIRTPPRKIIHFSDGPSAKYSDSEEEGARDRLVKTGEHAELSCGWVFLKLFDEQGMAIPNKTYELPVNGGTPFEKGVEVDPSISRRASSNRFRNLLTANKQPKLIIKLGTPNNTKKKIMNLLPANIVLPSTYCELVSFYRRMLADALIRDRLSPRDADPIPCPVLSTFPKALMQSDIMDALRSAWMDKVKSMRRGDKRDKENMKTRFRAVFLETVYVLMHSASLPAVQWAHPQVEQERWQKIFQHVQNAKSAVTTTAGVKIDTTNAVLKTLLSSNVEHLPFDMEELNFNLTEDHKNLLSGLV